MISMHVPNLIYLFSNSNASGPPLIRGHGIIRTHGASPSLDSGRGDSPESSCNSTLVLTPNTTQSKLQFMIFDRELLLNVQRSRIKFVDIDIIEMVTKIRVKILCFTKNTKNSEP